jgi:RNA recognition motif-containing protein
MKSDIVIEEVNGKKTGFGLVFLPNEETAQKARQALNKKNLGSRYVELLTCTTQDMLQ